MLPTAILVRCACRVDADPILNYTGGIFVPSSKKYSINHIVALVGFGQGALPNGTVVPYWVLRNSWGTYWGENGFMRIIRGVDAIGVESLCHFAVPSKW